MVGSLAQLFNCMAAGALGMTGLKKVFTQIVQTF